MKYNLYINIISILITFQISANIEYRTRCFDDRINTLDHAKTRNKWAVKCGFIPQFVADYYDSKNLYITFEDSNDNVYVAPNRPTDPCNSNILENGACKAGEGCYTGDIELEFTSYGSIAIKDAMKMKIPFITALSDEATFDNITYIPVEVESYISGKTKEPLYKITLEDFRVLSLTKTHPLVTNNGIVVKASTIKKGDYLVQKDGSPIQVLSVQIKDFSGTVYNIEPVNKDFKGNVHLANGILSGSFRYQSEWQDVEARILARKGK